MANLLEEMTKPVVAQIHGACLGLGAELALACDLRVMADDVQFGLPETKLGLIPDVGGSTRLPAVVGLGIAKELLMTGRTIDADECYRIGAANRVAPAPRSRATRRSSSTSCSPPRRSPWVREAGRGRGRQANLAASLEQEVTFQQILVATDDFREAGAASWRSASRELHRRAARRDAEGPRGGADLARQRSAAPAASASSATATSGNTQARYV